MFLKVRVPKCNVKKKSGLQNFASHHWNQLISVILKIMKGFEWGEGCEAGAGSFVKKLPTRLTVETLGVIPAGLFFVFFFF